MEPKNKDNKGCFTAPDAGLGESELDTAAAHCEIVNDIENPALFFIVWTGKNGEKYCSGRVGYPKITELMAELANGASLIPAVIRFTGMIADYDGDEAYNRMIGLADSIVKMIRQIIAAEEEFDLSGFLAGVESNALAEGRESARKLAESFGLFIQAGRLFTEAARDVLKAPEAENHKPVWENPFAMLSDVAKASKR